MLVSNTIAARSHNFGLGQVPGSLAAFKTFVARKISELESIAAKTYVVGSPAEAEARAKIKDLHNEVITAWRAFSDQVLIERPIDAGAQITEANRLKNRWVRRYAFISGAFEARITVPKKGIFEGLKDMLAGAGGLATIALIGGGIYLLTKPRRRK